MYNEIRSEKKQTRRVPWKGIEKSSFLSLSTLPVPRMLVGAFSPNRPYPSTILSLVSLSLCLSLLAVRIWDIVFLLCVFLVYMYVSSKELQPRIPPTPKLPGIKNLNSRDALMLKSCVLFGFCTIYTNINGG